jgi:hypothetical protein
MKSRVRGRTGFANRSFALRRCLVEILKRRDRMTAAELAGIADGRRLICPAPDIIGAQLHSWSRRGALRRLVAKGKVKMIGRYRRRKVFELEEREAR